MLTSTTTTMLRSGVARCNGAGIQLQPILLRSTACPYSTFAIRPKLADSSASSPCSRSSVTGRKASGPSSLVIRQTQTPSGSRRHASTVSSSNPNDQDAAAAAAAAAKQQAAHANEPPLDWNTFFALRKSRRRWQLTFSIASSAVGGTAGALFLSTGSADWAVNQIPLDPLVTLGLMTFGFAALGWLVGPALGSQIFYILNRKYRSQMALKESQFFARIKKHRVDPSSSSAGNPVPDFYGEKISSVAGYRQWLKDQRAFNKKRTTFV